MMNVAIFGGSFNPIHLGHIKIAEYAVENYFIDKLYFVPAYLNPFKVNQNDFDRNFLDINLKLELIYDSISESKFSKNFFVSDYEILKEKVSYTCDTVSYFKSIYTFAKIYLIVGSDTFITIDKWKNFDYISKNVDLIVFKRDQTTSSDIYKYADFLLKKYCLRCSIMNNDIIDISSTDIRKKIMFGEDISNLVSRKVADKLLKYNI